MKIGFFGCSFTEGGGLNSPTWNEYAIKHNLIPKTLKGRNYEVMDRYRFSTLIGNELNCQVKNFGLSGGSNESILNNLFDNYNNFDICVVQFSLFDRMKIYDDKTSSFYDVNGGAAPAPKNVINYFLKTITEHQNRDYEIYKVKQMIKLYDNLFEKINKKIIWLFADPIEDVQSKNILHTEPIGLHKYMVENKYTFKQVTNDFYDDWHWAPIGHRDIAKKIMEKIDE
jgi:hypothetical protein